MNRKEAIKVLSSYDVNGVWADVDGKPYNAEEQAEAFDMAIEALNREQEKYDAICSELVALKSNLNEPIEVAMAYENSIAIVRKYARKDEDE